MGLSILMMGILIVIKIFKKQNKTKKIIQSFLIGKQFLAVLLGANLLTHPFKILYVKMLL